MKEQIPLTQNLLRLNYEETDNLNTPITSTVIQTLVKSLQKKKSLGPVGFPGDF
jgi:hypothetical protein